MKKKPSESNVMTTCITNVIIIIREEMPFGYNIAYFKNSYSMDIFPDACVKKVIHPSRLDNEQHNH